MPYEPLKLSTPTPVLSWANHYLGLEETQMAKNMASLPFVFKHIALMPDVHLGKGALVGSVIATKDAVIPAAVGVDIGCFTGDTLIPLIDGKSYPLRELADSGKPIYVYSCTKTGKIVATEAIARLTRQNAPLVKVILDNGVEIKCTPDHPFMLRDGEYQEASQLRKGTSLMPFYSKVDRDGYTLIQQNYSGRWQKAHWIIARSGLLGKVPKFENQRTVIHHKNFNQADNSPDNLEFMGNRDHSAYHGSLVDRNTHFGLHNHRKYQHTYNHKVVDIIFLNESQDVYCLSVPEYHNFALSAGVFVHNCGMAAIKMPFKAEQLEGKLKQIRLEIEAAIPVGFEENKDAEKAVTNWQGWRDFKELHRGVKDLETKAIRQLGSLGGGNHFIELCLDTDDQVWLMLHSGSRHIGNKLAECHISTAKNLAKLAQLSLPDPDLSYFVAGTPEFAAYWHDLQWAQEYAKFNRDVMMNRFKKIVEKHLAGGKPTKPLLSVNCHHNYAEKEVHFGEEVYVTRKGAVRARTEDYGIIPGSMGAKSFIVKGKGSHDSYCSCFPAGTSILTEQGVMKIEDVFHSSTPVKLISYNQESQKFVAKSILDKSVRNAWVNQYSLSQTRRRLGNTICCTPDHPFATYQQGKLVYDPIEKITDNDSRVIIPTQISLPSKLIFEEQDHTFYYLLGVILSDGTIHLKERANSPKIDERPRQGKYLRSSIRIFQANKPEKQAFINYLETLLRTYSDQVSVRIAPPKNSKFQDRIIQGNGLIELTISDCNFVTKVKDISSNLSQIMLTNPWLALHFLAGYLDGDGSFNRDMISISVGKTEMFSPLVCTFLSLGIAYKVYHNRNHYVIEFRDNLIFNKLREICQRLQIKEPPEKLYSDQLLLAKTMVGSEFKCDNLTSMDKQGQGESLNKTLGMNRVFEVETVGETDVYNFTVEDHHNYIVFTDFYTPILVHNCSHGAGRLMSRSKAKKQFSIDDLVAQTQGVECRKDSGVLDEIPGAYKPIDQVMENQADLVEVVATLKQVLCVKG